MGNTAATSVVRCSQCGAANRVRPDSEGKTAVCGRCRAPLQIASAVPVTVTDGTFTALVENSPLPVLLDMWAEWCGPCRMIAPTIEALASELNGSVMVGKLDVDANSQTAARFGVQGIPTLLILKRGQEVGRIVGVQSKEAIIQQLRPHMA